MDFKFVGFSLGLVLSAISIFMLIPALVDYRAGNILDAQAFLICALAGFFAGTLLSIANSHYKKSLSIRESFLMTAICWIAASFLSCLPFHFTSLSLSYVDAFFESVSGFTTTGSTVISGLDSLTPGILIWRSLLQWIGGMGVIGLAIIFLPFLRIGGMQLFLTESSDKSDKAMPRMIKIVTGLFMIYLILTILCGTAYHALGMSPFDAINHAFATLSTGGYSTHDASMGYFNNPALYWAASLFMFLGSLPFVLFLRLAIHRDTALFTNSQVCVFFLITATSALVIAIAYRLNSHVDFGHALTHSVFNVVSVLSTTGFASTDYMGWGNFAVMMFLLLTYLGGCSGSTAGGLKTMRLQILTAQGLMQIKRLIFPSGVFTLTYEGKPVPLGVIKSVMVFLTLYMISNVGLTLLLTLQGLDFLTAVSGAATAIANVGPGVGDIIGPAGNFKSLSDSAKLTLCFGMIAGRLELITILILFHPSFWRQ